MEELKEITNAFTGAPEDSALAPLKGAHKQSAILKTYVVLAHKRLEQLLMGWIGFSFGFALLPVNGLLTALGLGVISLQTRP